MNKYDSPLSLYFNFLLLSISFILINLRFNFFAHTGTVYHICLYANYLLLGLNSLYKN